MDCVCCIYLPCFHVKHLCRSWWENLFHNSHFFGFCLKFLTGKTWEIGPRSNCHVDNSATTLQNLNILINLFHFDRISQFWPDFTILNKSQNFDQVSWFLVYFTIINLTWCSSTGLWNHGQGWEDCSPGENTDQSTFCKFLKKSTRSLWDLK